VLYLGCIQIAFAYWILTRAVRHVPAFEASLILLLEPVSNPVWSWLIHGERMDAWALSGAGLVLAGAAFQAWASQPPGELSGGLLQPHLRQPVSARRFLVSPNSRAA